MKISNFKLKFKTSQTTNLNTSVIINKILTELRDKKYEIQEVTTESVVFKWNQFRLVPNYKAGYILDGGNFEIIKSDQETVVVLSYFINILYSLIIIAALITFVILQGEYFGIFFFGIFYLIAASFQYTMTKNAGIELLRNIFTEDNNKSFSSS